MLPRSWLLLAALAACSGIDDADDGPLGGSLTVRGSVVDFPTGGVITSPATVSLSGLLASPRITAQGADFVIEGIPEHSAFQILAAAPPTHRPTFTSVIELTTVDLSGAKAPIVAEEYVAALASGFGVTPSAATGILLVHVVDGTTGMPRVGIPAGDLVIAGGADGPHFLGDDLLPVPAATASTSSGWAVFFEVPAGEAKLGAPASGTVSLAMATSPINAGTVTFATAVAADGAPTPPKDVSFAQQIVPIFTTRGCVACHAGGGPGKDLGGLTLSGNAKTIYKELVMERPETRVKKLMPAQSLVLTMPSRETPPDRHPNITFAGEADPDYQKLLVWITEGAKEN